jgi:hypothetical protein
LSTSRAIIASGADRGFLAAAVQQAIPDFVGMQQRLFANVDRSR